MPNGTQAAIAAGYAPSSAHVQAHRLLRHPEVVEIIAAERRKASEELGLHGRATISHARAEAVVSLCDYWTLDYLPPVEPGERSRPALRLKRAAELSWPERSALAPEAFDVDGELVALVLVDPTPAIVELGRRAGLPGFAEALPEAPTDAVPAEWTATARGSA